VCQEWLRSVDGEVRLVTADYWTHTPKRRDGFYFYWKRRKEQPRQDVPFTPGMGAWGFVAARPRQ
jgi:hypothetical protein